MLSPSKTGAGMISHAVSNTRWKSLYRIGGEAALFGVVLIPIQIIIFRRSATLLVPERVSRSYG